MARKTLILGVLAISAFIVFLWGIRFLQRAGPAPPGEGEGMKIPGRSAEDSAPLRKSESPPPQAGQLDGEKAAGDLEPFPSSEEIFKAMAERNQERAAALMAIVEDRHRQAIESAKETIPYVRDFRKLYQESEGFFQNTPYWIAPPGIRKWASMAVMCWNFRSK